MDWIVAAEKMDRPTSLFQCVTTGACGHVHSSAMPQLS